VSNGSGTITSVDLHNLTSDVTTSLSVASDRRYVGQTGTGALLLEITTSVYQSYGYLKELWLTNSDGTPLLKLLDVGHGATYAVDGDGVAALISDDSSLHYVDLSTHSIRTVSADGEQARSPVLAPGLVEYTTDAANDTTLHWQSRSGGPTTAIDLGNSVDWAVTDGSHVAWTGLNNLVEQLKIAKADGSGTPWTSGLTVSGLDTHIIVRPDGSIALAAQNNTADFGVYTLDMSTTTPTLAALVGPRPANIFGVSVGGGRLLRTDNESSDITLSSTDISRSGSVLTAGPSDAIAQGIELDHSFQDFVRLLGWGSRTAIVRTNPRRIAVYDESSLLRSRSLAASDDLLGFDGSYVLFWDSTKSHRELLSIATGAETSTDGLTLTDRWLYGFNGSVITRTDLATNAVTTVKAADTCVITSIFAYRLWFGWRCAGPSGDWVVKDPTSGDLTPVPSDAVDLKIGDGVLAYRTCPSDCELQTLDLVNPSHPTTFIGNNPYSTDASYAVDDQGGRVIAWVGLDGRAHVAPLLDPKPVPSLSGFSATPGYGAASLHWNEPWDPQIVGVRIRMASGTIAPADPAAGSSLSDADLMPVFVSGLQFGVSYSFSAFPHDSAGYGPRSTFTLRGTKQYISRASTITFGQSFSLVGKLVDPATGNPLSGPVSLYSRAVGTSAWTLQSKKTYSTSGAVSFSVSPQRSTQYTVRFPGSGLYLGSASVATTISVAQKVSAHLSGSSAGVGRPVYVLGSVSPNHKGQNVYLQSYYNGAWHTIKTGTLSTTSSFSIIVHEYAKGTYHFRIYRPADSDHAAGVSGTMSLNVA
jgi:hypothetical protein